MNEIELFRKQKQYIIDYVTKSGVKNISLYSASTGIPLIVIYTYVAEEYPEYKELAEQKIKSLREFYGLK